MKKLIFVFGLVLTMCTSMAATASEHKNTIFIEGGPGYHLSKADAMTKLTPVYSLGLRHYLSKDFFVQFRVDNWSKAMHFGTWYGPGLGLRHTTKSGKYFVEGSLGYGFLTHPDWNAPDGHGALKTSHQFEINLGLGRYVTKRSQVMIGIGHLSNCASICHRGQQYGPNHGKNWVRFSYGYDF